MRKRDAQHFRQKEQMKRANTEALIRRELGAKSKKAMENMTFIATCQVT